MKCNANMVYEMFSAQNCYERFSFEQLGKMFDLAEYCFVKPEFVLCWICEWSAWAHCPSFCCSFIVIQSHVLF